MFVVVHWPLENEQLAPETMGLQVAGTHADWSWLAGTDDENSSHA
jgi:hypothetical protein